jgi:uncharacterized protein (DUF2237 family)
VDVYIRSKAQIAAERSLAVFAARDDSRRTSRIGWRAPADHDITLPMATNVLGTELQCCCREPLTGFYRDGFCRTGPGDTGLHTVCVEITRDFLDYSVLQGNDLVTPHPEWDFSGLKPGDRWCVCVERWQEALVRGVAAPVDLEATHASALEFVTLEDLRAHALG